MCLAIDYMLATSLLSTSPLALSRTLTPSPSPTPSPRIVHRSPSPPPSPLRPPRLAGRLFEPEAAFYIANVTCALEYLQQRSIAYRDLKPENLMINNDGYLKVTLALVLPIPVDWP